MNNNSISTFVSALGGIAIVLNFIGSIMIATMTGEFNLALFLVLLVFGSTLGALLIGIGEIINQLAEANERAQISLEHSSHPAAAQESSPTQTSAAVQGSYVVPKIKREAPQPAAPQTTPSQQVVCPKCSAVQQNNRTTCWRCGENLK